MNKPHLFKVEDWTPEEAGLLDEMKSRCLNKGQYIDEKAKDKFKMLCHLEDYALQYYEQQEEIERLKNGYCELKVKCNNGECDCTNEEYDGMVEGNVKLSLENDELRNILEKMGTNPNEILYLKNEVDELNNIINEFEKWLQENIKISKAHGNQTAVNIFNMFLDKLKELKEGK